MIKQELPPKILTNSPRKLITSKRLPSVLSRTLGELLMVLLLQAVLPLLRRPRSLSPRERREARNPSLRERERKVERRVPRRELRSQLTRTARNQKKAPLIANLAMKSDKGE